MYTLKGWCRTLTNMYWNSPSLLPIRSRLTTRGRIILDLLDISQSVVRPRKAGISGCSLGRPASIPAQPRHSGPEQRRERVASRMGGWPGMAAGPAATLPPAPAGPGCGTPCAQSDDVDKAIASIAGRQYVEINSRRNIRYTLLGRCFALVAND